VPEHEHRGVLDRDAEILPVCQSGIGGIGGPPVEDVRRDRRLPFGGFIRQVIALGRRT